MYIILLGHLKKTLTSPNPMLLPYSILSNVFCGNPYINTLQNDVSFCLAVWQTVHNGGFWNSWIDSRCADCVGGFLISTVRLGKKWSHSKLSGCHLSTLLLTNFVAGGWLYSLAFTEMVVVAFSIPETINISIPYRREWQREEAFILVCIHGESITFLLITR